MGLFDGFSQYLANPENAARIRGALIGAGQAASQPYGNLGSIAAGFGAGGQTGIHDYQQAQAFKSDQQAKQLSVANDRFGMQQKLAGVNFMRSLQGQPPLTLDDVMSGKFSHPAPMSVPPMPASAAASPPPTPMPAPMVPPSPPMGAPQPQGGPPAPMPIAAPQMTPPPAQAAVAPSPASSVVPPELMANPLFQAALQSGDQATVMKMLTTLEYDKTPHPGINPATGKPGEYILGPNGAVKWLDVTEAAKSPTTSGGMYYDETSGGFKPIPGYTEQQKAIAEAGRAPKQNWQVLTDPKTNTQYRYDMDSGQALTLDGKPYTPGGAAKIAGGMARSPAALAAQRYLEEHPDATAEDVTKFAADYGKTVKSAAAFSTGKQGDLIRSFNVAISHLNTLDHLVDALGNNDVQALNKFGNAYSQQFGKAAPTNFDAAKAIVGDEIIKAIVGGGGALADRENAQNQINRANSPAQLRGVISTYKELMAGQLKGLAKQYADTTGNSDFNDRLSPETKAELEGSKGAKVWPTPPSKAIQDLKMRKDRANFDAIFGPGAADRALNAK